VYPFKIEITDNQLDDLLARLRLTRLPGTIFHKDHEDGISLPFMRRLLTYWIDEFDWRIQESHLNQLPHFKTNLHGHSLHFVWKKGVGPTPLPLILTHGWPGSFAEFDALIEELTDPARFGGDSLDAFDVVVPSLPGFGFSAAPTAVGTSTRRIAEIWHELMISLGYNRFFAQGGDHGAGVSTWLAALFPQSVAGVHLNYISASFRPLIRPSSPPISAQETAFLERAKEFAAREGAYMALQATKPQTLAFSLSDSPLGLAAWMAEKYFSWSDHNGNLESVISLDQLLTNVCLYWFSNSINASLRIYKENSLQPLDFGHLPECKVPFSIAHFPRELPIPPRSWVERALRVERWTEIPRGGHFAALEHPAALAEDIRASFRHFRI